MFCVTSIRLRVRGEILGLQGLAGRFRGRMEWLKEHRGDLPILEEGDEGGDGGKEREKEECLSDADLTSEEDRSMPGDSSEEGD